MKVIFQSFLLGIILMSSQLIQAQKEIIGVWYNEEKDAKVQIYESEGKFWGKIVWLKNPTNEDGSVKIDKNNPDPKLRSQKLIGLKILRAFKYSEDKTWDSGRIYNPRDGEDYKCIITLQNNGTLKVRGYIGWGWASVGKTQIWTPAN